MKFVCQTMMCDRWTEGPVTLAEMTCSKCGGIMRPPAPLQWESKPLRQPTDDEKLEIYYTWKEKGIMVALLLAGDLGILACKAGDRRGLPERPSALEFAKLLCEIRKELE